MHVNNINKSQLPYDRRDNEIFFTQIQIWSITDIYVFFKSDLNFFRNSETVPNEWIT